MSWLQVRDLKVTIPTETGRVEAVRGLDLNVEQGEIFGILGESGSGKTMTGLALLGLTPPGARVQAATLRLGDTDLLSADWSALRGRRIAMIFQDPAAALNPVFTIGGQIDRVLRRHRPELDRAARRARALSLLADVGLGDPAGIRRRYPHQLSGGMQQRALIAIALSAGAELLIADEPTTALDTTVQAQILRLLKELRDRHRLTILLITHDFGVIAATCDRAAVLDRGRVVETGAAVDLLRAPAHPYTRALLAAVPRRGSRGQRLPTVGDRPEGTAHR